MIVKNTIMRGDEMPASDGARATHSLAVNEKYRSTDGRLVLLMMTRSGRPSPRGDGGVN